MTDSTMRQPSTSTRSMRPGRLRTLLGRWTTLSALLALTFAWSSAASADTRSNFDIGENGADTHRLSENGRSSLRKQFPWAGEQFFYSLRVNGAEALRATLKVGDLRNARKRVYVPIGMSVHSRGFFDNIYSVDDRADTYLNPRTMQPYRSEKYFQEAGKTRTYIVDYAFDGYRADVEKRKPDKRHRFKKAIPATTHDMVTWLYDFRKEDYEIGEHYRYFVYDGWKLSHVYITVIGKEDLYTPAGWFKAWKFRFVRKVLDSKHNKPGGEAAAPILRVKSPSEHSGHFWLSRDENHLPLRVTIPTSFGFGEAVLMKYNRPDQR